MHDNNNNPFEQSLAVGEKAFSSLIEDTVPVWPEMYEVLYAYESGQNVEIRSAIEELKRTQKQLDLNDLHKIHDEFFCNSRLLDVSEDIGNRINAEIRKIVSAMKSAGERSDEADLALGKIETKFSTIKTPEQLHGIVEILSDITRTMADNNRNLNAKLQKSTQQIEDLHKDLEQARSESNTDPLTGLANRKKFDSALRKSFEAFHECNQDLCLLIVDIDHFKKFNDTWGHQTGDQILRLVAQALRANLKGRDLAARYGGEEFAIILPDTTLENAFIVADQIREDIATKELIKRSSGENLGRLTVSIGIATAIPRDMPASLIAKADKALYEAKETGRNRCVVAPADEDLEAIADIAV